MLGLPRGFWCAGPGDLACVSQVTQKPSGGARVTRSEFSEDPGWTGLTGALHRSDRCRLGTTRSVFPLRIRGLRVAALFLGSVAGQLLRDLDKACARPSEVILGYRPSSLKKNFYQLPFTPPSLVTNSVLQ